MHKFFMAATIVALFVTSFADAGRVVGSGPDQFGGYTTDYILVRFEKGQVPMLLNAQRGATSVWAIDRASAKWRVSRIDAINPDGYGSPGLADQLGLSRTFMFRVPRGTDVVRMVQEYSVLPKVEFA